jgi:Domain of unknown function (DUF4625)
MKKISFAVFALLGFSIAFMGCNKEKPPTTPVDEEFPTIVQTSPAIVPLGSYVYYNSNDSIIMDIRFEDDVELDRYEITLSYEFDLYYLKTDNFPWEFSYNGDLDGQSGAFNEVRNIVFDPSAGPHKLHVKVWDKAGNMTETTTYLFITNLNDTQAPNVNIIIPTAIDSFNIGDMMTIKANINDPAVISNAYARVRNLQTKALMPGSEIFIDSIWQGAYVLDTFVNVQAGTVPGDYWVEVYSRDDVYNVGYDTVHVFIRP